MTGPHICRAFACIAIERGIEPVNLGNGRRYRKWPAGLRAPLQARRLRNDPRGASGLASIFSQARSLTAIRLKPGRAAETFRRRSDEDVGMGLLRMHIHAGEGGHSIDDQIGAMLGDHRADLVQRIERAGRRVMMAHRHDGDFGAPAQASRNRRGSMISSKRTASSTTSLP